MADLAELLARVEAATESRLDDDLLGAIICAAHGATLRSTEIGCGDDGSDEYTVFHEPDAYVWRGYRSDAPDVSTDAALELVAQALPGWMWSLHFTSGAMPVYVANLLPPAPKFACRAATPPLALLAALLRALSAQSGEPEPQQA